MVGTFIFGADIGGEQLKNHPVFEKKSPKIMISKMSNGGSAPLLVVLLKTSYQSLRTMSNL